jgi:hypothetical protein
MAFETNRLVDGQWTTHTLDVNAVLKHYDKQDREANIRDLDIEKAPALGLLTQTVVRSPLVHWILPAKLRNPERNDVAFIGVRILLFNFLPVWSSEKSLSPMPCTSTAYPVAGTVSV